MDESYLGSSVNQGFCLLAMDVNLKCGALLDKDRYFCVCRLGRGSVWVFASCVQGVVDEVDRGVMSFCISKEHRPYGVLVSSPQGSLV